MATDQQIAANRRNARNSTGPRSAAGKKRASRNAYRHGLAAPLVPSEALEKKIEQLARKIAGDTDSAITMTRARTAAEAELDLARVRRTKVALIELAAAQETGDLQAPRAGEDGHAGPSRTTESTESPDPTPSQELDRSAEAVRRVLPELLKLDRYERGASARRDRAIREIVKRDRS